MTESKPNPVIFSRAKDNPHVVDLILKSKNGDQKAFTELINMYKHKIAYVVRRYVHEPSEASDVCQEVFIKVYKYINTFKGDSMFYTWLYSITARVAKNHLINLQRLNYITQDQDTFTDHMDFAIDVHENVNPQDILVSDETLDLLTEVINKLPKLLREVIILREIEGLSYDKIAEVLSISPGTVRSRLFRARTIIEEAINLNGEIINLHKPH